MNGKPNRQDESFRILVTGSRNWDDRQVIADAITEAASGHDRAIVVHGACRTGADAIAHEIARELSLAIEPHPANWAGYGRAAGPVRNAAMVSAGAGLCLAFIRDHSPGATGCADLAERAGIPVRRFAK